ncbi:hypothetical protein PV04_04999 [Phialophora macrospora]|uniref:Clr5 domain-containing protein n=1 Tax=Phialophora macrospora TaxID=1851006 RepID=A0A0D2GAR8_9EURO|nr:hypothetical protein PV04_04999 [Phialophora macrospora]
MSVHGISDKAHPSKKKPTASQWEEARPKIKELYIIKNFNLSETMAEMAKGGFLARSIPPPPPQKPSSPRRTRSLTISSGKLYKEQLRAWGMGKNATRDDWLAWAKLYLEERAITSSSEIYIQVHNKIRRIQELRRYLKNIGEREEAFFDEAMRSQAPVPQHIHICNPDGSVAMNTKPSEPQCQAAVSVPRKEISPRQRVTRSPNDSSDVSLQEATPSIITRYVVDEVQATERESAPPGFQQPLEYSHQRPQRSASLFAEKMVETSGSFDATDTGFLFDRVDAQDQTDRFDHLSSFNSFQCVAAGDVSAMHQNLGDAPKSYVEQDTFLTPVPIDAFEQGQSPLPISHAVDAQHTYTAACMIAAMLGAAGRKDKMEGYLEHASGCFRQMCRFQSPAILTAASVVLTWLLVHAEGSLSERVMAASLMAATESLGLNNPVCELLEWMTAAAARGKLRTCRIASSQLRHIWHGFCQTLGIAHGHTIVALYCLSMQLILADKAFAEAEQHLRDLAPISANVFGSSCVLTINILATLSRAQLRQGKSVLALESIHKSLAATPLGLNHPHRLELLLRKALILRTLDQWHETEELYWIVFKGRVATLGWQHSDTSAAHDSLVWVMKEKTGSWEAKKGEVHRCLVDPQVSVTDYESWWRRFVEENRATKIDDQDSSGEESFE